MRREIDLAWEKCKAIVWARSQGRCEVTPEDISYRCAMRADDPDHTIARWRGRRQTDRPELVIAICRVHHRRKQWPYMKGRLVITPRGDGTFSCRIVYAKNKQDARAEDTE